MRHGFEDQQRREVVSNQIGTSPIQLARTVQAVRAFFFKRNCLTWVNTKLSLRQLSLQRMILFLIAALTMQA